MTIKLCWENDSPVPARTRKTLQSSWDFVPDQDKKQTVSMYPIMHTGAMGLEMEAYARQQAKVKQAKQKALLALKRIYQKDGSWEKRKESGYFKV